MFIKQNKDGKTENRNKNIHMITARNHTKAILLILSQPRRPIFLFCECS